MRSMWALCRAELGLSRSSHSATAFLIGLKGILIAVNREGNSKRTMSPALVKALQRFLVTGIFSDLCTEAVPSVQHAAETVWTSYLHCLQLVPSAILAETEYSQGSITPATVFGVAVCAALSVKTARKVEAWLALQEQASRDNLLSTLAIATQVRQEHEMKDSILSLFEVMLVKGTSTISLYLLAAKIAFWWGSQQMQQLQYLEAPIQQVSSLSSFFVTRNLTFAVHALPHAVLLQLFSSFVDDLPPKLAVLCKLWNISDAVSNRASRIWKARAREQEPGTLSCIRDIVQFINGGELE